MSKPSNLSWADYIRNGLRHRFGEAAEAANLLTGALRRQRIYQRFKAFTMIWPDTYRANLAIAEKFRNVPGCIVECGVWRGGMSAGLAVVLGSKRQYFLFDSFEGLPPAKEIDGREARAWQANKSSPQYFDNCSASKESADAAMQLAGCTSFTTIKGWFDDTMPKCIFPEAIAVLRLDGDWYDSTMVCLRHLFTRVTPGGVIILDDYYTWDGCARAVHDYLSQTGAIERIESFGGVCFIRKRAKTLADS